MNPNNLPITTAGCAESNILDIDFQSIVMQEPQHNEAAGTIMATYGIITAIFMC